jgi:hypothetical protein
MLYRCAINTAPRPLPKAYIGISGIVCGIWPGPLPGGVGDPVNLRTPATSVTGRTTSAVGVSRATCARSMLHWTHVSRVKTSRKLVRRSNSLRSCPCCATWAASRASCVCCLFRRRLCVFMADDREALLPDVLPETFQIK